MSKEGIISALAGMKIRTSKKLLLKQFKNPKYLIIGTNDPVLDPKETQNIGIFASVKSF